MYDVWDVWLLYDVWDVCDVCAVCPYIGVTQGVYAVWVTIQRILEYMPPFPVLEYSTAYSARRVGGPRSSMLEWQQHQGSAAGDRTRHHRHVL